MSAIDSTKQAPTSSLPRIDLNVAVLGCGGSGVSSFVTRHGWNLSRGQIYEHIYDPTLEVPVYRSFPCSHGGAQVRIEWDDVPEFWFDADHERLGTRHLEAIARGSDAFVFLYSCTSRFSFEWLRKMWEAKFAGRLKQEDERMRLWVVANKLDVEEAYGEVPAREGKAWSAEIGAKFRCVSARNGEGFDGMEEAIARDVLESRERREGRQENDSASEMSGDDPGKVNDGVGRRDAHREGNLVLRLLRRWYWRLRHAVGT